MVAIGIDLSSGFTHVAFCKDDGKVDPLKKNLGIPSIIAYYEGQFLVGEKALKKIASIAPKDFFNIVEVLTTGKKSGDGYSLYTPQEIAAIFLKHVKKEAEAVVGPVEKAVIAISPTLTCSQRMAVKLAGRIAGFKEIGIINSTTAAVLSYCIRTSGEENLLRNMLVFQLRGSECHVARFNFSGAFKAESVLGCNLGGDVFSDAMLQDTNRKNRSNPHIIASEDLVKQALGPYRRISPANVKHVVMLGTSVHIPAMQEMLRDNFPDSHIIMDNALEHVAFGAAARAQAEEPLDGNLRDKLPNIEYLAPMDMIIKMGEHTETLFVANVQQPAIQWRQLSISGNKDAVEISLYESHRGASYPVGTYNISGWIEDTTNEITVLVTLDSNGIYSVSARDTSHVYVVKRNEDLSDDEIKSMTERVKNL